MEQLYPLEPLSREQCLNQEKFKGKKALGLVARKLLDLMFTSDSYTS
jgi:hypothetical protein